MPPRPHQRSPDGDPAAPAAADGERVFLIATRGIEDLVAAEFTERIGGVVDEVGYRRVAGRVDPAALVQLRLPDDAFLDLAAWAGISHTRAALADLGERARELPLARAIARIRELRALPSRPRLAIAVSHVGTRNYSAPEVRACCARALAELVEPVERDDAADLALRVFLEHDRAWLGLRVPRAPLHERPWRQHRPGALRASVAAAMARWAHRACAPARSRGPWLADPCCGGGGILVEAAHLAPSVLGSDTDPAALAAAARAAAQAAGAIGVKAVALWRGDAARLPLGDSSLRALVCNLPWDRQVRADDAAALTRAIGAEARRVVAPGGAAALLTTMPAELGIVGAEARELSVSGQRPTLVLWRRAR